MSRINFLLAIIAVAIALMLVTTRHEARKLVVALEQERKHSREIEIEWGQLQLEQSTWATPQRVEKIAQSKLLMSAPDSRHIVLLSRQ
ncbi:MAG: cell division protein FtsL [Burkholderiales bacterium]